MQGMLLCAPPIASRLEAAGGLRRGRQRWHNLMHNPLPLFIVKSLTTLLNVFTWAAADASL